MISGRSVFRRRARSTGGEPTSHLRKFRPVVRDAVAGGVDRVALLAGPEDDGLEIWLAGVVPDAAITRVDVTESVGSAHVRLVVAAPFDVVVDATRGSGKQRLARLLATVYHLRTGGVYVARTVKGTSLERLLTAAEGVADVEALRRHVAIAWDGAHLVLTVVGDPVFAKLDEQAANEYLDRRPDAEHRVVETVPGVEFASRCAVTENTAQRGERMPPTIVAPDLFLREYRDVRVDPGQVVTERTTYAGVVFPDSYRRTWKPRLTSTRIPEVAPLFAVPPGTEDDLPVLRGSYVHLDNEARGHFGHLVTEQVSRLWGWTRARAADPGVKALIAARTTPVQPHEWDVLRAAGIGAEDLVVIDAPVRVERLISASPLFAQPQYVHPRITETWDAVGDALAATGAAGPERIFASRKPGRRACRNGAELEAVFAAHGFEVVFPEDHPIGEQVALFRGARAIAGYAGSGMLQLCFVREPVPVVLVGSQRYRARNEYFIASVRGNPLTAISCPPVDPTDFNSDYTFAFERDLPFLERTLAAL